MQPKLLLNQPKQGIGINMYSMVYMVYKSKDFFIFLRIIFFVLFFFHLERNSKSAHSLAFFGFLQIWPSSLNKRIPNCWKKIFCLKIVIKYVKLVEANQFIFWCKPYIAL